MLHDVSGLIDDPNQPDLEVVASVRSRVESVAKPKPERLSKNPAKDMMRALNGALGRIHFLTEKKLNPMDEELKLLRSSVRKKLIICAVISFGAGYLLDSCSDTYFQSEQTDCTK